LLPSRYSLRFWQQELPTVIDLVGNSLFYAVISSALALILVIACLEYRQKFHKGLPVWLITLPLITPQLSLLFGIQIATFLVPGQHYQLWVLWSHLLFVFPYLYLTLDGAWRSYDIRLDKCSQSLGKTAWQTWWQVKRPQVQPAIIFGLAVGISVSLAQYLPTQMLGAGRISTITTEAVALASGQDRRVMAIYGLLQGMLPLLFFTLALSVNRLSFRYRRNKRIIQPGSSHDTVCH
jgi:putative thiamine transport system permease protein